MVFPKYHSKKEKLNFPTIECTIRVFSQSLSLTFGRSFWSRDVLQLRANGVVLGGD